MSTKAPLNVLIVGASGVFGSRLARLAKDLPNVRVLLGGRRREPLDALRRELGTGSIRIIDRDRATADDVAGCNLVLDCAGPFQGSHSRLIEACLAARCDYADLADGREFVARIGRFDEAARNAKVAVISGVSSIPALSHAVLDQLTRGWREIDAIRIGIFPGNRAPRGRSVVEAILSYVGKPVRVFTGGVWTEEPGWSLKGRMDCGSAGRRWASVCDTPEQDLLVARYRPIRSAEFVAGLELPILHLGLWLLSWPVRWGLVGSLRPAAGLLLWLAQRLQPFGSDRGAMIVEADGAGADGRQAKAKWLLDAPSDIGPNVPIIPALALIRRIAAGWRPDPGARPCSGILELGELADILDQLGISYAAIPAQPEALAA